MKRRRLVSKLNEGLGGEYFQTKLTLVSAPAGFGKTTLISHWLASSIRPYAWLSLDEDDNDPVRFLTYLVAALQKVDPALGRMGLAMLQDLQPPPLANLMRTLVNEAVDRDTTLIVVLDDYHVIADASIHAALIDFINHLPPQLHLVLITRSDPPFPLARLRLRHELTELRAADLSFTAEEASEFLHSVMDVSVPAEGATSLTARTEGWVAGLQAAALSLRNEDVDNAHFIEAFSGSSRYILDYLAEEVLRREPPEIRRFLFQTAILDRMCAPLCRAVVKSDNTQTILETLEDRNLFIVPLDHQRRWYRYHHLFADFLRARLERDSGQDVPLLHRRASCWYRSEGFAAEAIKHALKAQDFESAAALMASVASMMASGGEAVTLLRWIEALPKHFLTPHPGLGLSYASALLLSGHVQDAEQQLTSLEQHLQIQSNMSDGGKGMDSEPSALQQAAYPHLTGHILSLRALAACWSGEVERAASLSRHALADLPEDDLAMRGLMATNIALNLAERNGTSTDLETAIDVLRSATKPNLISGNAPTVLPLFSNLGDIEIACGRLHAAEGTFRRALELAELHHQQRYSVPSRVGAVHVGLGRVLYEWNQVDSAIHHFQEGLDLLEYGGSTGDLAFGQVMLAEAYQAQDNRDAALAVLQTAEQMAQESEIGWLKSNVNAMYVRLWLADHQIESAERWADVCGLSEGDPIGYRREEAYFALARVLLVLDRLDEALSLVSWLRAVSKDAGMQRSMLKAMVLQALTLHRRHDREDSFLVLDQALKLAEPEGYKRLFLDESPAITELLYRAIARHGAGEYVSGLLAGLTAAHKHELNSASLISPSPAIPASIDTLSERELEVLRLIAAGLSNREIAETLVIAIGTTKRHITNIYGKLDVHNRTQAVGRGRDLNLL